MHEYFEQLSKVAGFSEEELVSLYDLPAIVATLNISKLSAPSFPQLFLYSRCRGMSDSEPVVTWDSQDCLATWNNFVLNPIGIYSRKD